MDKRIAIVGCGGGAAMASLIRACDISCVAYVAHEEELTTNFNHGGWADVGGTEEVAMLTRDIANTCGLSVDSVNDEIRRCFTDDFICAFDAQKASGIAEIVENLAVNQKHLFKSYKEVPHYRDLEFKKKKRRF